MAPRSHNLIYLSEESGIILDEEMQVFLGILMKYQLEGRYPDFNPVIPSNTIVENYLNKTKELTEWL